ncbi:MAG: flagellar assembly factor FliW [Halanaerobiales bacterium]|nr:flagellar assembly factor FliW [Halanaerobiales bacterium]
MKIETTNFGIIEVEEEKIISFTESILGFEDYKEFAIIDSLDDEVFYWLQSVEEPELSFIMINPLQFVEDYEISLSEKFQKKIELGSADDVVIYTLVVIGEEGSFVSTNLKAPIIINAKNRKAGQIILKKDYPTRYYLFRKDNVAKGVPG